MQVGGVGVKHLGERLVKHVLDDDVIGLSAELAYNFFLSLFPFFIFVGALGGFIAAWLGVENPARQLVDMIGDALPPEAAETLEGELEGIIGEQNPGALSFGIIAALFFATGGTNAIIKAMDRAYRVPESRSFWHRYLLALGLTLLAGTALIGAFVLLMVAQIWGGGLAAALGLEGVLGFLLTYGLWPMAFLLILLATTFLYWKAPNIDAEIRWMTPGAVVFLLGWVLATSIFGYWVGNFADYGTTYGTLAGVAVLMVWFNITAFILLLGAEVNAVVDEVLYPDRLEQAREAKRQEFERKKRRGRGDREDAGTEDGSEDRRAA
jgi:membrane protein